MSTWTLTSSDYPLVRAWLQRILKAQATRQQSLFVPPDMAEWCGHLQWLNSCMAAGVLGPSSLNRDEMEGLRALDEVSRELHGRLARCQSCGAFTEKGLSCRACGRAFNPREAKSG